MFGVISASYTDRGGAGGVPALTTVAQNQIRQKQQEVEFVVNQSGTNTAASTDVGGGPQRGSLSAGDWIELNGPFNLLNIDSITFRVTGGNERGRLAGRSRSGATRSTPPAAARSSRARRSPAPPPARMQARRSRSSTRAATHRLFLVFANANTYSLNWTEFGGAGISVP